MSAFGLSFKENFFSLNIEILHLQGVFLDKVASFFHIFAHKDTKKPVSFSRIFQCNS